MIAPRVAAASGGVTGEWQLVDLIANESGAPPDLTA